MVQVRLRAEADSVCFQLSSGQVYPGALFKQTYLLITSRVSIFTATDPEGYPSFPLTRSDFSQMLLCRRKSSAFFSWHRYPCIFISCESVAEFNDHLSLFSTGVVYRLPSLPSIHSSCFLLVPEPLSFCRQHVAQLPSLWMCGRVFTMQK